MAHSVLWPKKTFFYPIGNTPPVCFTQDVPPEKPVNALLLGCGDPRSILYTVYADLGVDRKIDFTCCDNEAAILARNTLLFTLIFDSVTLNEIWNIFFHFYIDMKSLTTLRTQCKKLIDLSAEINTWNNSRYGTFLQFCTQHTLFEVRRHWVLYGEVENPSKMIPPLQNIFSAGMRAVQDKFQDALVQTAFRSAGPLYYDMLTLAPAHFRHFWATGIAFDTSSKMSWATLPNPTFAYSAAGRGFAVHYGTDPLLAFHLAEPLVRRKEASHRASLADLVKSCKSQFYAWCVAFRNRVSKTSSNTLIRFFAGDALAFSCALGRFSTDASPNSGVYTHSWSGKSIEFDGGVHEKSRVLTSFDVIDTSNLTDHLGLVNVLVSTIPLLSKSPHAILHTNTLLSSSLEGTLSDRMCADVATLSLMLGITPVSYASGFTMYSGGHEIDDLSTDSRQRHQFIAWRPSYPAGDEPPTKLMFHPKSLGAFFFKLYLSMFSLENIHIYAPHKSGFVHYIRTSFVALLSMIKRKIVIDWELAMYHLMSLIEADNTLFVGRNNYQDLVCQLHIQGVYTARSLQIGVPSHKYADVYQGWGSIPPIVCVVLQIPRSSLKALESIGPDAMGTPIIHCEVQGSSFHNAFSSIQLYFGSVESYGKGRPISIDFDELEWAGSSPLIVSFYMPSWMLVLSPKSTTISLNFRSTPTLSPVLIQKLGLSLQIYSASLTDNSHVYLTRERPGHPGDLKRLADVSSAKQGQASRNILNDQHYLFVHINEACTEASHFVSRTDMRSSHQRTALAHGEVINMQQISPSMLRISSSELDYNLSYPFPIDERAAKLEVSQTPSYIKVHVPLLRYDQLSSLPRRSVLPTAHTSPPILDSIHYINLDRMPLLKLDSRQNWNWIKRHIQLSSSNQKRDGKHRQDLDVLLSLGSNIVTIIAWSFDRSCRLYALREQGTSNQQILLFMDGLRLDLLSRTVVADVYTLPIARDTPRASSILTSGATHAYIELSSQQFEGWKNILPALAERCRTWQHNTNCKYLSSGENTDNSPLCGCGLGKVSRTFKESEWGGLSSFVTRVALSPLFLTSFPQGAQNKPSQQIKPDDLFSTLLERLATVCRGCGQRKSDLKSCSRCKTAKYCSKTCQNLDWKSHKISCKAALE